jgi:hypothetical protein
MSSDLLQTTARNLVSVTGFGYGENVRLQQIRKAEAAAAPCIRRFDSAAPRASRSSFFGGKLRPC